MEKVAIIGSGISGLAMSYLLKDKYDVTLYEKNNYFGGHSRTLECDNNVPVDTGFIVFNYETYFHLSRFFKLLDIKISKSSMSFGVSIKNGNFEYGSEEFKSLFAQKKNMFKPSFIKMLFDIFKFNRVSRKHIKNNTLDENVSLEQYLDQIGTGKWFKDYYLLAMGAAIWSTPVKKMFDFPALTFIQFFNNHGLLNVTNPIQWYTVDGGSREYVKKVISSLNTANVKFEKGATKISRNSGVKVTSENGTKEYDKVIFACHSNQVLELLDNPSNLEIKLISNIKYQDNKVILHKDDSFMPKNKNAWSSWIYLSEESKDNKQAVSLSYWMNNLQKLNTKQNYFVTVNPDRQPAKDKIINEHIFEHPLFNKEAIQAQKEFYKIQGNQNTYYCGAYLRYGFHEDGILSAVNVANSLGIKAPWQ